MRRIGIVYGKESAFPAAFVDRINSMGIPEVSAEHVKIGAVRMDEHCPYRVIVDRVSHEITFYREWLKSAALGGATVINNPFGWDAGDIFFNNALASRLGVATPRTVVLPHKHRPPGTTDQSMRNLIYPIDWHGVFHYVGFPAILKPIGGGAQRRVYRVTTPEGFFEAYNDTGDLCMTLQQEIQSEEHFRCYVVGRSDVHAMRYDPSLPREQRFLRDPPIETKLHERVKKDCLTLCRALGCDLNAVEFAVENGVPYAIDCFIPPDADPEIVGEENFEWIVDAAARLAVEEASKDSQPGPYLRSRPAK